MKKISKEAQAENRAKWYEGLRSGKYRQQTNAAFENIHGEVCAMGVAAKVLDVPLVDCINGSGFYDHDVDAILRSLYKYHTQ